MRRFTLETPTRFHPPGSGDDVEVLEGGDDRGCRPRMAGGWGGALALGSQGALWGSSAGPVGTVVGGVGGGMVGYIGGEKLTEVAVEMGSDAIYSGVNAIRNATHSTGKQLEAGANVARSSWNSAWSRLGW